MKLYEKFELLLNEKNYTIAQVSKGTGIPYSTLDSIIKKQQSTVALENAFKIAKFLGITIEELASQDPFSLDDNSLENQLRIFILKKHSSLREFAQVNDIPYSTLINVFKIGISNSSIPVIVKICKALNISADELSLGNIVENKIDILIKDLSDNEKEYVHNLRLLDARGKHAVLDTIERELLYSNKG